MQTYQQFAWNLGQTVLRSESESHFLPADWPTFAQMDASRAQPGAAASLGRPQVQPGRAGDPHRGAAREPQLGYERRVLGGVKVGWIVREPGRRRTSRSTTRTLNLLGRCKHA